MGGEPLACPFCASDAKTSQYNGTTQATCGSGDHNCPGTDVLAPVDLWNRRASPPAPSGSAWGVKPLVWTDQSDPPYYRCFRAATPVGRFAYGTDTEGKPWHQSPILSGEHETEGAAREAAERAYFEEVQKCAAELGILSALTPAPSYAEGVEAAAKVAERMYVTDAFRFEFGNDVAAAIRELAGKAPAGVRKSHLTISREAVAAINALPTRKDGKSHFHYDGAGNGVVMILPAVPVDEYDNNWRVDDEPAPPNAKVQP